MAAGAHCFFRSPSSHSRFNHYPPTIYASTSHFLILELCIIQAAAFWKRRDKKTTDK
jgi:hypothetical protein